jgi:hypothetical protein
VSKPPVSDQVPARGEEILILRPGFPDIRMRFARLDPVFYGLDRNDGWLWLEGDVLEGMRTDRGYARQTLYARPVRPGVYQMVGNP